MKRTFARRLLISSLVAAGAAASVSACSSADPTLPADTNPVIVTASAPPAISGGTLLVTSTASIANLAVAADSDRDVVWLVDLATQHVVSVPLQAGDEPGRVVADNAGRVHVALRGAGAVATIDLTSGKVVDRTAVCSAPRGLAIDSGFQAGGDVLHVACAGGELITLPAAGGAALRSLRYAGRDLRDVVVQGNTLLVTRFRTAEVLAVDAQGNFGAATTPASITGAENFGASFTPTVAWRAIPGPGNTGAFLLHQYSADSQVVISQPGGYGSSGGGGNGCDGSIVHSAVTQFGPGGMAGGAGLPMPTINGATVPVDLAFDGSDNLAVVSAGSDSVLMVAVSSLNSNSGDGCVSPENTVALSGQPVAVAAVPSNGFIAQIRELDAPAQGPALVFVNQGMVGATIALPGATRADTGHYLFHHDASTPATATSAATVTALACASCHPEGHEDGHIWTFDTEGQRRTQTVSGGVLETAPLHWDGSQTDLSDIMTNVFVHRMGGAPQGPRHVDAFGDWLNRIPAYPASPTGTTAQIEHGSQIFHSAAAGCDTCHSGAHFTNNQTVDVGTGQAFQVPTLIGVAARTPFMHDGCATTLADRFELTLAACNGGEKHGHTADLAASDVADLIAYLESL